MTAPVYLLDKVARHGQGVERLRSELRQQDDADPIHAIAFDAANFVWSFLVLSGHEAAQESRYIRNAVAEGIIEALQRNEFMNTPLNLDASDL